MKKFLLFIFITIIVVFSLGVLIGFSTYSKAVKEKPLLERVNTITSKEHYTPYTSLPKVYIDAVVATEDRRFYKHGPVDFISIGRAIFTNIKKQELEEGGSTITQQVAKNIVFDQSKSITRKLGEFFAAYELEKNYSKDEILALYVNSSYFGDGYYCIYDASMGYYKKEPKDLTLSEAAMLAGVPNAPSVYSPTVNKDLAKKRREHVLDKMLEERYISKEDADNAKKAD